VIKNISPSDSVNSGRGAFTLVELLIVIAIIALLAQLSLPAIEASREAANRTSCSNNLRQLAIAVHSYHDLSNHCPVGRFRGVHDAESGPDAASWSWMADVLPQLEGHAIYEKGGIPIKTHRESGVVGTQLTLFLCPSDGYRSKKDRANRANWQGIELGLTNYAAVSGANWGEDSTREKGTFEVDWPNSGTNGSSDGFDNGDGMMYRSDFRTPRQFRQVLDGLSNTFMIGETLPTSNSRVSWPYANHTYATCAIPLTAVKPDGSPYGFGDHGNVAGFRSAHSGGCFFSRADCSVDFINDSIELDVYRALATIAGGEATSLGTAE
jgi:prepilin-type N-terminal cleavage/methylation domain-containing protein